MSEIRIQKNETEELQKKDAGADFESFRQIIETLRSENGCPWDRAQTLESLKPCMVNEMTEAIAGIDLYRGAWRCAAAGRAAVPDRKGRRAV